MPKVSSRSRGVAALLQERQAFNTHGAMYAEWNGGYPLGRLPEPWRGILLEDTTGPSTGQVTLAYIVYSYETPIAWWTEAGGWVIPPVKYTPTTSKHQSRVTLAVGYGR